MAEEIKLPDLGEEIESGDVVNVLVSEGDTIEKEQTIAEVETDKAVLEVPSTRAGKVTKVHVSQGDTVKPGQVLLTVEAGGGGAEEKKEESQKEEPRKEEPPAKEEKQAAGKGEQKEDKAEKKEAKPAEAEKTPAREEKKKPAEKKAAPEDESLIPAGPATRRLARELGLELGAVASAYPGERLTEDHLKEYARKRLEGGGADGGGGALPTQDLPDFGKWGEIERKPFTSLQRKTAHHLQVGWLQAPHVTQFDDADITALEALRKRFGQSPQGKEVRLTVTAFILKAVSVLMKEFPTFNSALDTQANQLVFKQYCHLGVAVDTDDGLIVPVLRDVDQKNVLDIAAEMNELAERTRQRKVGLDELRGGCFTITNLGGIGGTYFTPVINYPEVAILGVGRWQMQPRWQDGQWVPRKILPLGLSYDHRVINGADGARFIRRLVSLLEDPEIFLLQA